jgi:ubiquinol-cytochrome c reductase cytochrome b subunit
MHVVGDTIVTWPWGDFSVDNATLNHFLALIWLGPMLVLGLVIPPMLKIKKINPKSK